AAQLDAAPPRREAPLAEGDPLAAVRALVDGDPCELLPRGVADDEGRLARSVGRGRPPRVDRPLAGGRDMEPELRDVARGARRDAHPVAGAPVRRSGGPGDPAVRDVDIAPGGVVARVVAVDDDRA